MVRAWVDSQPVDPPARPTVDADLAILPARAGGKAHRVVEVLLGDGFRAYEEPFRLVDERGRRVDLLVPPRASRHDPPRIGALEVFEAPGSRFAFELPAEPVSVRLGQRSVSIQVPALAGALVCKAVALATRRPGRARVDAVDVGLLLAVIDREPGETVRQLREHRRRTDVKGALRALGRDFAGEGSDGAVWVEQERGKRGALLAVASARDLLGAVRPKP